MTWSEFKQALAAAGVEDETELIAIDYGGGGLNVVLALGKLAVYGDRPASEAFKERGGLPSAASSPEVEPVSG